MPAYDRRDRVEQEVRKQLYEAILSNKDIEKPQLFSVLRCEVTRDMRNCKAFISVLGEPEECMAFVGLLNRFAPSLRAALGARVRLHHTPALAFEADDSIAHSIHMGALIDSLNIPKEEPGEVEKTLPMPDDEP